MSRDIEINYIEEYHNEEKQCHCCDSFFEREGRYFCQELEMEVLPTAHCDFFRSVD